MPIPLPGSSLRAPLPRDGEEANKHLREFHFNDMNDSIDAIVEFSFKGEDYHYNTCLDLGLLLQRHDAMPSIHDILAKQHNIDTYSYLYEIMQGAEIEFSNPQGLATDYLTDGEFNLPAFEKNWQNAKTCVLLRSIASRELGIDDLTQHHSIQRALVEAYNLGKKA